MASSLNGIGEIVAYLPYEFGFVPRDSLVVVGVRHGAVVVCARLDRPGAAGAVAQARHLARSVSRAAPDEVIVLGYDGFGTADRLFTLELSSRFETAGVEVSHVVEVSSGAWRAERCACGGCPRDWAGIPPHSGLMPVAERVLRGVAPVPRRSDLEGRLDLAHPRVATAVEEWIRRRPTWVRTVQVLPAVLLDRHTPVPELPVEVLAPATFAVASIQIRDDVLRWLMPGFLPAESVRPGDPVDPHHLGLPPMWLRGADDFDDPVAAVADRLEAWVSCLPVERTVPVLMLLAGLRWTAGNGALASMAVERALQIDPRCRLATLIDRALQHGLRPTSAEPRSV